MHRVHSVVSGSSRTLAFRDHILRVRSFAEIPCRACKDLIFHLPRTRPRDGLPCDSRVQLQIANLLRHHPRREIEFPGAGPFTIAKTRQNPIARCEGPSLGKSNGFPEYRVLDVGGMIGRAKPATRHGGKKILKHISHRALGSRESRMSCSLQGLLETYLDIGTFLSFDRSTGAGPVRPRCNGTSSPEPIHLVFVNFPNPLLPLHLPRKGSGPNGRALFTAGFRVGLKILRWVWRLI